MVIAILALSCARTDAPEQRRPPKKFSIGELQFRDRELGPISRSLIAEAQARHIDVVQGENRIQALLALEALLNRPPRAMDRFNAIAIEAGSADASMWADIRKASRPDFAGRRDPVARRVNDLLDDWQREKLRIVERDLSDGKHMYTYGRARWEIDFHDFVRRKPMHAATWGRLVLRAKRKEIEQQYGTADSEHGYRYYVEFTGLGTSREAKDLFSVPLTSLNQSGLPRITER